MRKSLKYGLIDRPDFFDWLEKHWRAVFSRGPELEHAIAVSCKSKAAVVARDETEQGDRALLNLGHTFGHALEKIVRYDSARLVHGEGVAIGMACAFRFSAQQGLCPPEAAERVEAHMRAVGLPTRIGRDLAGCRRRGGDPRRDGAGQEGQARRAHLHPRARHRRVLHRQWRRGRDGARVPAKTNCEAETDFTWKARAHPCL